MRRTTYHKRMKVATMRTTPKMNLWILNLDHVVVARGMAPESQART